MILAILFISVAGCDARSSEAVALESPVARQEEEVRQFIGFDRLAASLEKAGRVAVVWPDVRQFFPRGENDWEVVTDQVEFADVPGLVERLLIVRKGDAQMTFDLFVSSSGSEAVLNRLVDTLVSTSIGYRRYQPGPQGVGQFALLLPLPNPTLLLIDRNVFVRIRRNNHTMELEPLAREIAKFMESHVVSTLGTQVPMFGNVRVAPPRARVGESVRVSFQLPESFPREALTWKVSDAVDADMIDKVDQGDDYVELRFKVPGRIEVPFWLADRRTLLSSETRTSVEVVP